MSHVNVTINGRQFRMACEEGQEARQGPQILGFLPSFGFLLEGVAHVRPH